MHRDLYKRNFTLLNTDHIELGSDWNYKNITSTFYRIYLVDRGEGKIFNHEGVRRLEKGQLYLIPSFTLCNYKCFDYLSQYYLSCIEESADGSSLFWANRHLLQLEATSGDYSNFKRLIELNPFRGLRKSHHNPKTYEKQSTLQSFRELNNKMTLSTAMETQGIILQLLARFLNDSHFKNPTQSGIHSKVLDAINYLQSRLEQNITVAELAARANQHPDYFSKLFIDNTGERPLVYLRNKRIERAQFLLSTTQTPFADIAEETGFCSLSYFSKTFKSVTGLTPSQFKNNESVLPIGARQI